MGTILEIPRKKGSSYRAEVRRKGHKPLCKTFQRKTDAQRWINEQEATIYKGGVVTMEVDRKTVGDLIQRFLDERVSQMIPSSQNDYGMQLRCWGKNIGHLTLRQLRRSNIIEIREKLRKDTYSRGVEDKQRSPSTVNRYLAALSTCCSYGVEIGMLEMNPCIGIKRLAEPRGRTRFLSDDERERLLKFTKLTSPQLHLAVVLSLATGARQSEIWGLHWKNIDLKEGYLTFEQTKNGDIRKVPVLSEALDLLCAYHSQHRIVGRDELFPGRIKGKTLDLRTQWESVLKQADIKDFRWHDLRHSCASYLVRQGVDLRLVAELLGHRTLQMSMRYSHLAKEHLKSAISEAMEK
jgi:integrase